MMPWFREHSPGYTNVTRLVVSEFWETTGHICGDELWPLGAGRAVHREGCGENHAVWAPPPDAFKVNLVSSSHSGYTINLQNTATIVHSDALAQ